MGEDVETLFEEGVDAQNAGHLQEASDIYQRILAIHPGHAPSLHRLGIVAYLIGRHEVAASLIEAAVKNDAAVAMFHGDLGEMYRRLGRRADAERALRHALQLDPQLGSACNNLAILLHGDGRLAEAVELYRKAVALMPEVASARMNLGTALLATGDVAGATASLEAVQSLAPEDPTVMLNLGNARMADDRPDDAASLYRAALTRQPQYLQAELNLGRALRELGQPREALTHYQAAISLDPASATARWNAGSCHLLLGDYRGGWSGFAERWAAGAVPAHGLSAPAWTGDNLAGKRLLVHTEQGLGDTLQFVRFMPLLAAANAAEIHLLCQPPLHRLLSANGFPVVDSATDLPAHDLRVPLLDLPRIFDIGLATLPHETPYLTAEPMARQRWRQLLPAGRRIGLVWQGRRDHANDRARSMESSALAPLLVLPDTRWYSLQKDARGPLPDGIEDLAPDLADLSDTAAAIMELDAVVAVDTAVAHLAGALGKPVYLLLPFAPDWRWLTERDDSPWYPSMKLVRQSTRGDWDGVVARLAGLISADSG